MQQRVRVARLLPGGEAEVFVVRESACSGDCHRCSGCGAAKQQVFVRADNPIGAQVGDCVIVSSRDRQVLAAMAVVFVVPLVLLLAGYLGAMAAGLAPALGALGGLALGIALMLAYNAHVRANAQVRFTITAFAED